jgi:N-acetylglucosaminyl-diphospho-decaprenol L-rhamnosyltransferase
MIPSPPLPLVNEPNVEATIAPDLSVVLVSYNTRDLLDACLKSLGAGLGGRAAEIWVVDNASRDGSAEQVRASHPGVRLIVNPENIGFACACNQALRRANGKYLLLLNPDSLAPPGALDQLAAVLDTHPEAAVCGPLLLNTDGSPQISWARFPTLTSELRGRLDRSQSPYRLEDFAGPARRAALCPFAVDWVGGACFLVRAEAARGAGLLDEGFFLYGEEVDWCRRFRRAGGKVLLAPAVTVTHQGGASGEALATRVRRRYLYRAQARLYRRLYGPIGSLPPVAVAAARYLLSPLRRRRATVGKP